MGNIISLDGVSKWFGHTQAAGSFVDGLLGPLLDLPNSVSDASPFNHVPQVPAAALTGGPLPVLTLIAAAFAVVGLWALRRRDIGVVR